MTSKTLCGCVAHRENTYTKLPINVEDLLSLTRCVIMFKLGISATVIFVSRRFLKKKKKRDNGNTIQNTSKILYTMVINRKLF